MSEVPFTLVEVLTNNTRITPFLVWLCASLQASLAAKGYPQAEMGVPKYPFSMLAPCHATGSSHAEVISQTPVQTACQPSILTFRLGVRAGYLTDNWLVYTSLDSFLLLFFPVLC